jgi:2-polyprenyl-3-methyl-5-hydroxy-6-metoxy-1,4-benzoquinol methylase
MTDTAIREYYESRYGSEWEEAFPADPSRYRAWFGSRLEGHRPGSPMLDYGCGVGYVCSEFADRGYEVTGVDIAATALNIARQREPRGVFREPESDGSLPFADRRFDVIACLGVLEHITDPRPIICELRRVARADAVGIWVVPNVRSPFFWFGHGTEQVEEHPRTLNAWRELLVSGGWTVTDVRRDPGPLDRPVARWKKWVQAVLNRLPLQLTYQFVIETRPTP